jgi:hypothetical protein
MAVIRFTLDGPSVLDDELFGLGGPSAFILDASTLDGDRVLDGGQFLTTATGTATLGALSATATSTVTHFATATAELGELVADIAEVIVTTKQQAKHNSADLSPQQPQQSSYQQPHRLNSAVLSPRLSPQSNRTRSQQRTSADLSQQSTRYRHRQHLSRHLHRLAVAEFIRQHHARRLNRYHQ